MHTAGIDKIALTSKEFKVLDGHLLSVKRKDYKPNDPDQKEEPILFGNQRGEKAYFNHSSFNMDLGVKGISISFNPSKILHPYHLNNNESEIRQVWDFIREELKTAGVLIPNDNELKLWRVDMAKNVQMKFPNRFYTPVMQSLKGKRMEANTYPGCHTWGTKKTLNIQLYDKTEEVERLKKNIEIDPRIMRGEIRAKNTASVGRVFKLNDLDTFLKVGSEYRIEKYNELLVNKIFADGNRSDQLALFDMDYEKELAIMKLYKEKYPRNAIVKWMAQIGYDALIEKFGNLENWRYMLLEAGFHPKSTFRIKTELTKEMQSASFFQTKNKEQNLTNLYNELFTKFAV
jgi:hypothetical protein